MNDQELITIVERSATLGDRLNRELFEALPEGVASVNHRRLETWCQNAAAGNAKVFQARLGWDGMTPQTATVLTGDTPRLRGDARLPAWTSILREATTIEGTSREEIETTGDVNTHRLVDPAEPVPFEEILIPFVLVARERVRAAAGHWQTLFSPPARRTAERGLLARLAELAGEVFMLEFSLFRDQERSAFGQLLAFASPDSSRSLYDNFLAKLRAAPGAFFAEYAVLARLLATLTTQWVEAQIELSERLQADLPAIVSTLGWAALPGPVTSLQTGLSDPHQGGRQVCILTFGPDQKVVYKPKDLGLDQAFARLLAWLNEHGASLPLQPLRVVNRTTHGWVEFIAARSCETPEEASRYYRRAGMLLCLLYVLEGTDLHLENLIASGDQPVLVDLETVPHPFLPPGFSQASADAHTRADTMMWDSVIRTGLLPWWSWGREGGEAFDPSGLGADAGQSIPIRRARWEQMNTDGMSLSFEQASRPAQLNLPRLNGVPLRLEDHEAELVEGFGGMHRLLREQRTALLAEGGPLSALANQTSRFVHRTTRLYAAILARVRNPRFLRDGLDYSLELEVLARALVVAPGYAPGDSNLPKPPLWDIVAAERAALAQGDIPFFTVNSSGHDLPLPGIGTISRCFPQSGFERVAVRLAALDEADQARQTSLIRSSFYTRRATSVSATGATESPVETPVFSAERLIAMARSIGQELAAQAIRGKDGSVTWIVPQMNFHAGRYMLQRLDFGLYDGVSGLVLFLAALEHVTGNDDLHDLALGALEPLKQELRLGHRRQILTQNMGLGAASGLGGLVYTLARSGSWLRDESLLAEARDLANLIAPELAGSLSPHDLLGGMAGAILGLLALHQITRDEALLEKSRVLGRVMIGASVPGKAGGRAWPAFKNVSLTGFSHGAAGSAYALGRLYRAGGGEEFLAAAREAIAFEKGMFDPAMDNWPDLTGSFNGPTDGPARFRVSWCHGAPGIGLGRLGALDVLDTAQTREDIEVSLRTTLALGLQDIDFLCCGNLGRVETLLTAARQLSRPELETTVQTQVMHLVERARRRGSFGMNPLLPKEIYNPAFFTGTSGIGYMLMRVACPDRLPSVLRME